MESLAAADLAARDWVTKVVDWNICGNLPEGLSLADGVRVREDKSGGLYEQHGNFPNLREMNLAFGSGFLDVWRENQDSALIAILPFQGRDAVFYRFKKFHPQTAKDPRSGFGQMDIVFMMQPGQGQKFLQELRKMPGLMDSLVAAKFPDMVKSGKIQPWDKLLYLPPDLNSRNYSEKVEKLAPK